MLPSALAAIALAAAPMPTPTIRDAPWRLTGISGNGRTLHLVYEGGGCNQRDGQAQLDTSDPTAVRITVRQTTYTGDGVVCTTDLGFLPLDVDLGAPLAGRYVTGGPDFAASSPVQTMPNVVRLRRTNAIRALKRQQIELLTFGRRKDGVVHTQLPDPDEPIPVSGASLSAGSFDPRARLQISVPKQTVESVVRRGLRYRFAVDPAAEAAISAEIECNGRLGGSHNRATKHAGGRTQIRITEAPVRRKLRKRKASTCRLFVESYPADARDRYDWLVRRTATVTLEHR